MHNSQPDITSALNAALDRHQSGDLEAAHSAYARILRSEPTHPDVLHLFGVVTHQLGRNEEAECLVRQAIENNPDDPFYHNNLGEILLAMSRPDDALASFYQAQALNGEISEFQNGINKALQQLSRLPHTQAVEAPQSARTAAVKFVAYSDSGATVINSNVVEKVACTLDRHTSLVDCLHDLDAIIEPSDVAPDTLSQAVPCLYTRIKHRIIRLRRRTHSDWPWLETEIEAHSDRILTDFDTRWLVSLCDTYADYGDPVERRNAMLVSLLVGWEKLARTQRMLCIDAAVDDARRVLMQQAQPLWDGVVTMALSQEANVVPNLFFRLGSLMAETPILARMLNVINMRMQADPASTLSLLDRVHSRDLFADIAEVFPAQSVVVAPVAEIPQQHAIADEVTGKLDTLTSMLSQFIEREFRPFAWYQETRYRDVVEILERTTEVFPELDISLHTQHPVAVDSPDHLFPHGTARDNTRAPWFVRKCEQIFGRQLTALDLGCAGGGQVFEFSLRGHTAVGLEGSDFSKKRARAEWRLLGDRLFTCDIRMPFELYDKRGNAPLRFDVVTAWDVIEHIDEPSLPQFLANIHLHLKADGLFIGTVSTRPSGQCPDGRAYHATVHDRAWWVGLFAAHGFELLDEPPFDYSDYPRGNGSSPVYPADFASQPGSGFHVVLRPLNKVAPILRPTIQHHSGKPEGVQGIQALGHREYVGGMWDEMGRLQLDFLISQGMTAEHTLLDIACGSLRAGVHFISYLEPGHYLGIDKEAALIEAGVLEELGDEARRAKRPEFIISDCFDFSSFTRKPDFAIAQSLFTHLNGDDIRLCLKNLRDVAAPGHRFFCTFFEGDTAHNPETSHSHDCFTYTRAQMEAFGHETGWVPTYIGDWSHPRGQMMMQFVVSGAQSAKASVSAVVPTPAPAVPSAANEQWSTGIDHEIEFWDQWLTTRGDRWPQDFEKRLDAQLPMEERVAAVLREIPRDHLKILDVGAGPLTVLGKVMLGKTLEITAIDPLANEYNNLIDKHGITPPVRSQKGFGERLHELFAPGTFDLAHAQNCLDHGIDPLDAVRRMVEMVKPDGRVILFHHENEGIEENYAGFHQWNFTERDGELIICARDGGEANVHAALKNIADAETRRINGCLLTVIRKRVADTVESPIDDLRADIAGQAANQAAARTAPPADLIEIDKKQWLREIVAGKSFADIGGLWGTANEMVTVGALAGSSKASMVDMQPVGNRWWQAFHERAAKLGVNDYQSIHANLEDADFLDKVGVHDVVHCSGIIYHAPDPMFLLRQLFRVTGEYLILTSMVIPDHIANEHGDSHIEGGEVYFVPALNANDRQRFGAYFDSHNIQIAGINAPIKEWMYTDGNYNYGPWWWLWTPAFIIKMLELFPCEIVRHGGTWGGKSHSFLVRKLAK